MQRNAEKIKILFICHGNICRSPMAEFIFKRITQEARVGDQFMIASAATSTEEIGNGVYPPVRSLLEKKGYDVRGKRARQITRKDYQEYDHLILMDEQNRYNAFRIWGSDPEGKVSLLMDYTDEPREIDDPWYTRDFQTCYDTMIRSMKDAVPCWTISIGTGT